MFKILKNTDKEKLKSLYLGVKSSQKKIPEEAKFKVKISSEAIDRDGEIVKADGLDMEWFIKNPVVLANHIYNVETIIGKATKVWQEGTETFAEGYFSQSNPRAKIYQGLYNEGMLKVVSIGFMVKERHPENRKIITKSELLEFSFVAVQSNREAESLDGKKLELYKKAVKEGIFKEVEEKPENDEQIGDGKDDTGSDIPDEFLKGLKGQLDEFKTDLAEIKQIIKTLADDKAEEVEAKQLDQKVKEKAQNLAKSLSPFLEALKKQAK